MVTGHGRPGAVLAFVEEVQVLDDVWEHWLRELLELGQDVTWWREHMEPMQTVAGMIRLVDRARRLARWIRMQQRPQLLVTQSGATPEPEMVSDAWVHPHVDDLLPCRPRPALRLDQLRERARVLSRRLLEETKATERAGFDVHRELDEIERLLKVIERRRQADERAA